MPPTIVRGPSSVVHFGVVEPVVVEPAIVVLDGPRNGAEEGTGATKDDAGADGAGADDGPGVGRAKQNGAADRTDSLDGRGDAGEDEAAWSP
jgi:hypothetical protein